MSTRATFVSIISVGVIILLTSSCAREADELVINRDELVVNGSFDLDADGWQSYQDGLLTVVDGKLNVTNGTTNLSGRAIQSVPLEIGEIYRFNTTHEPGNASGHYAYLTINPSGSISGIIENETRLNLEEDSFRFTATTSEVTIVVGNMDGREEVYSLFDNISLKKINN